MVFLTNGLFVLSAIVGNILYVEHGKNIREGFICISLNNSTNTSWPVMWKRMNTEFRDERKVFTKNISKPESYNSMEYKLRLYYFNNTYVESDWNAVFIPPCNEYLFKIILYSLYSIFSILGMLVLCIIIKLFYDKNL